VKVPNDWTVYVGCGKDRSPDSVTLSVKLAVRAGGNKYLSGEISSVTVTELNTTSFVVRSGTKVTIPNNFPAGESLFGLEFTVKAVSAPSSLLHMVVLSVDKNPVAKALVTHTVSPAVTTITAGSPATLSPSASWPAGFTDTCLFTHYDGAGLLDPARNDVPAWTAGQSVAVGNGDYYWDGSAWRSGVAPTVVPVNTLAYVSEVTPSTVSGLPFPPGATLRRVDVATERSRVGMLYAALSSGPSRPDTNGWAVVDVATGATVGTVRAADSLLGRTRLLLHLDQKIGDEWTVAYQGTQSPTHIRWAEDRMYVSHGGTVKTVGGAYVSHGGAVRKVLGAYIVDKGVDRRVL